MKNIILISLLFISGCGFLGLPRLSPVSKDEISYLQTKKITACGIEQSIEVSTKPSRLNFWQKLGNITIWSIVICLLLIAFTPQIFTSIVNNYITIPNALRKTVKAIEDSDAVNKLPELKAALNKEHDNKTRSIIGEMKANI